MDGVTGSQTWYYLCEITEYPQPALYTSAGCADLDTPWLLAELWKAPHS